MKSRIPGKELGLVTGLVLSTALFGWLSGRNAFLPGLLSPGLSVVQRTANGASSFVDSLGSLEGLREENVRLHALVTRFQRENVELRELQAENARLKSLLGLDPERVPAGIVAQVIGRNPDNWFQRILINKGRLDGIALDSPAVAEKGLIGKVTALGNHTAWVTLITDPSLSVSCLNQRTRVAGILAGQSSELPVLNYVQQQADFRVGDALITSGFGGVFPKGLPVGVISKIAKDPTLISPQIRLLPAENMNRLEEVRLLAPHRVALP